MVINQFQIIGSKAEQSNLEEGMYKKISLIFVLFAAVVVSAASPPMDAFHPYGVVGGYDITSSTPIHRTHIPSLWVSRLRKVSLDLERCDHAPTRCGNVPGHRVLL